MNNEWSMRLLHGVCAYIGGLPTFPKVLGKIEAYIAFPGNLYAGNIPNLVPELGTHSTYCYYYTRFERRIIDGSYYINLGGVVIPSNWEYCNLFMELNLLVPVGDGTYYREPVWPMGWQRFDVMTFNGSRVRTKAVAPPPAGSFYEYIIPPVSSTGGKQNTVGIWGAGIGYNTTDRTPCYCVGQTNTIFSASEDIYVRDFNVAHYKKLETYNFSTNYYVYDRFTRNLNYEYVLPGQIVPKP